MVPCKTPAGAVVISVCALPRQIDAKIGDNDNNDNHSDNDNDGHHDKAENKSINDSKPIGRPSGGSVHYRATCKHPIDVVNSNSQTSRDHVVHNVLMVSTKHDASRAIQELIESTRALLPRWARGGRPSRQKAEKQCHS